MVWRDDSLAAARRACGEQARARDRERFLCSLFASEPARSEVWALLAFNAEIARTRETVSEAALGQIRLQWWRESIDAAYAGTALPHPVVSTLTAAIERTRPPRERFERLLHTREHDLYDDPVTEMPALEAYADGTSGELSLLELDILGVDDLVSRQVARQVGIAWALTGLIRATPFLARQRRLLLPADLLAANEVSTESLFLGQPDDGLRVVLRAIADRARNLLHEARTARADVARAALPALLPARLAERHLDRLDACDFNVFAGVPAPNPAVTTATLWWAHRRGRY